MPNEKTTLLESQFAAIVKANDKVIAASKKGMAKDYAQMLKNLKYVVASAYEQYASEGSLSYAEMQRYNRIKKLNDQLKEVTAEGTKPIFGRIKNSLEEVATGSFTGSLSAIGEVANANIGRELSALEINNILQKPISGVTLDERMGLRRTDIGNRIRSEVTQGIIREDTYEEMVARIKDTTVKDYARNKALNEDLGHQVQNDAFVESFKDVAEEDIEIFKVWVTAGDQKVRDSHAAMDGQEVLADEKFTFVSGPNKGVQTDGPGLSGTDEDFGCRCWIVSGIRRKQ